VVVVSQQSSVTRLNDLLSQFVKLSDDADVTGSEHDVNVVNERLNELNNRLSARRSLVNVSQRSVVVRVLVNL